MASTSEPTPLDDGDGALVLDSLPVGEPLGTDGDYLRKQPSLLADTVQLKEYQLLGVNWLNLLYRKDLSCILADEMGKRIPACSDVPIFNCSSFHRFGQDCTSDRIPGSPEGTGSTGPPPHHRTVSQPTSASHPHLEPRMEHCRSSTLENWIREFDRFAPSIEVQTYYGSQKDRIELRNDLRSQNWDVLVTTYTLAQGDERDRKFFRKFDWQVHVFRVDTH